jgi:heme-degrading monooxygenase HmoA
MFAVVTHVTIQAGKTNDYLQLWAREIKPRLETFSGYQQAYVLLDKAQSQALAVVFYRAEADADEALSSGLFREVTTLLKEVVVVESITRTGYEVALAFQAPTRKERR